MKLKIYTETQGIPPVFYPIVLKYKDYFTFADTIEEAEYVLIPLHWEVLYHYYPEEYSRANFDVSGLEALRKTVFALAEKAYSHEKPLIVFFYRDDLSDLPLKNAYVFRTSILASQRKKNVFAMTAKKGDILVESGIPIEKSYLEKSDIPTVGFRGAAAPFDLRLTTSIKESINAFALKLSIPFRINSGWEEGYMLRRNAMLHLLKNKSIKTDFGVNFDGVNTAKEGYTDLRKSFVNNIMHNQYNLCVKGVGNYSYRFYETISAGRIPIFVNTDCVLPYDFIIDWKQYCVWVESKDIAKIDKILLDFHNRYSNQEFIELQKNIRRLYDEWLDSDGFMKNFYRHFEIQNKQ